MLGSLRPRCALSNGSTIPLVFRPARRSFQTTINRRQRAKLEPLIPQGETPDPQIGDYPRLEGISTQSKPPLGYWDAQYRRNFNETVHEEDEALNMFSPDLPHAGIKPRSALLQASLAFAGFGAFITYLSYTRPEAPAARRSYPHDGLVTELGGWEKNKARTESLTDS